MVISIIGILVAILLPALAAARESGRQVQCLSNLRQIGVAVHIYADQNDERLPLASDGASTNYSWRRVLFEQAMGNQLSSNRTVAREEMAEGTYRQLFWCPTASTQMTPDDHYQGRGSYAMNWYFNYYPATHTYTINPHRMSSIVGLREPMIAEGTYLHGAGPQIGAQRYFSTTDPLSLLGMGYPHTSAGTQLFLDGHATTIQEQDRMTIHDDVADRSRLD